MVQTNILSALEDGKLASYDIGDTKYRPTPGSGETKSDKKLQGSRGKLALGKPGDVITRAYGPVVRAAEIKSTDIPSGGTDVKFGTYVAGKGILVNSGDCAAVGERFDTVTGLKAGQVGSFLVSGACVVEGKAVQAIANAMVVQYLDPEYINRTQSHADDTNVYEIEVNGFDTDVKPSVSVA